MCPWPCIHVFPSLKHCSTTATSSSARLHWLTLIYSWVHLLHHSKGSFYASFSPADHTGLPGKPRESYLTMLRSDVGASYSISATSKGGSCSKTVGLSRLTGRAWRVTVLWLLCCCYSRSSVYLVAAFIFVLMLTFISILVLSYLWYSKIYRQSIIEPLHKPPEKQKKN